MTEHLAHSENYNQYKPVYQKYQQLDAKKRDAFYDKHEDEIQRYEAAKSYLDEVMNGNKVLPIKAWKDEALKLTAEKYKLCEKFYGLKDEIQSVEALKRGALKIMSEETPERDRKPEKTRGTAR